MDKAQLFRSRLPEDDVDLPGVGKIRVRALSRAESLAVRDTDGWLAKERRILACAMVDPKMTENEVAQWQAAAGNGELDLVTGKVAQLSGMEEDSGKEAFKSDGGQSGD